MSDTVAVAFMGGFVALATAYLDYRAHLRSKRACGDAPCVRAISKALNIKLASDLNMSGREKSQP